MKRTQWTLSTAALALAFATLPALSQRLEEKEVEAHAQYLIGRSEAIQDIAQARIELWALRAKGAEQAEIDRKAEAVQAAIAGLQDPDRQNASERALWRGCQGPGVGLGLGRASGTRPHGVVQGQAPAGQGLGSYGYGLGRGSGFGTGVCPYGGGGPRWGRGGGGGYGTGQGLGPRWAR